MLSKLRVIVCSPVMFSDFPIYSIYNPVSQYFSNKILRGIKTNQILAFETTSVRYFNKVVLSNDDSTRFLIHCFCTHVELPRQLADTR